MTLPLPGGRHGESAGEAGTIFHPCSAVFGEVHALPDRPHLAEHHGVLLWQTGLYDDRRQLIADSAFFRGVPHMHCQEALATPAVPERAANRLPDGRYFWIGPFHLHFGHYMVSTLARLWALAELDLREWTLLYVGAGPPDALFRIEFVRDTLTALGIRQEQLLQVAGPLFIPRVTVAQPALVENYGASRAFGQMLSRMRCALLPGEPDQPSSPGPVYVTKERVPHGIRSIANENEVTAILSRHGVAVASPETSSFREQLRFWGAHRTYAGFAGSAFHLAAAAGNRTLCTVSHDNLASCNQVLLDRMAGNRHLYVHAGTQLVGHGADSRFTDVVSVRDPALFARDLLHVIGRLHDLSGQAVAPEPRSVWPDALNYEPFGRELARTGRASQSSDYEIDEGHQRAASGALSGRLTGIYQCSTQRQDRPWWQVELPGSSRIHEVRIYNRAESPVVQERLAGFMLLTSRDGTDWSVVHVHDGPAPGREPFRWQARALTVARFVRIALPGDTWLHLDQVEVFGEPVAPG